MDAERLISINIKSPFSATVGGTQISSRLSVFFFRFMPMLKWRQVRIKFDINKCSHVSLIYYVAYL